MRRIPFLHLTLALALTACAGAPPGRISCALRDQRPMVEAQLFFGRDIEGRGPVSDAEWSAFAADVLTANFPDGFTVYDGQGQWRDPASRKPVLEATKIVIVAAAPGRGFEQHIVAVTDAYERMFHQQSVGLTTHPVCGRF